MRSRPSPPAPVGDAAIPVCRRCESVKAGPRTGYPDVGPVCDACLVALGFPPRPAHDGHSDIRLAFERLGVEV